MCRLNAVQYYLDRALQYMKQRVGLRQPTLTAAEEEALMPPANATAHAFSVNQMRAEERWLTLVHLGRVLLIYRSPPDVKKGVAYLKQAVALDPYRSEALSSLAQHYAQQAANYKFKRSILALQKAAAMDLPRRALEHKPYLYACTNKVHFANVVAEWHLGAHFTFGNGKSSQQDFATQAQARRAINSGIVQAALKAVAHAKQHCEHNELVHGSARSFLTKVGQTLEGALRDALAQSLQREEASSVAAQANGAIQDSGSG
jgi:hypothetical protein